MRTRNSRMPRWTLSAFVVAALLIAVPLASAAAPADDSASASVYNDGWQTGDNGGNGMGAWTLGTTSGDSGQNGHFIGDCDIAVSSRCWALYANSNQTADAVRTFSTAMQVNETFVISMDNGWINDGKVVGFGLRNSSGGNLMEFYFVGNATNYTISDNAGAFDSGVAYTDQGLKVEISLTASTTYDIRITRLADNAQTTLSNRSLANPAGGQTIAGLRLFNFSAGSGANYNAYFNSILVRTGTLAVTLADFHAVQQGDAVLVTWETASELNNRGFNLYRGTSSAGWDRQLNTALIPSQSQGNPSGFVYNWLDEADLVPGTSYFYWLEDVDVNGAATMHGPVSVDFVGPTAVTLSGVQASPAAGAAALPTLWIVLAAGAALGASRARR